MRLSRTSEESVKLNPRVRDCYSREDRYSKLMVIDGGRSTTYYLALVEEERKDTSKRV